MYLRIRPGTRQPWLASISFLFLSWVVTAWANGEITTREESASPSVATAIALLGGAIAILGVFVAVRGGKASSNLEIKFGPDRTLKLTKLTQGVVIVLIGAAILIAGIYNLPKTTKEETMKAKTIEKTNGRVILRH